MRPLHTILATASASLLLAVSASAATNPSVACRGVIAKQGAALIKTALKVLDACHTNRDKGKFTGNCNDLTAADAKNAFTKAASKATAAVDKKCQPDDAVRDNYADRQRVAAGIASAIRASVEASGAALEGGPPLVGDKARTKCRKAIGKSRSTIVAEIVQLAVRCQKTADKTATTFGPLTDACLSGPVKTGPKTLATLAKACGTIVDLGCAPFPSCVVGSATASGQALAAAIYEDALFPSGLQSDTDVVLVGEPEQASFRVKLGRAVAGAQMALNEVNPSGNVVAKLTDLFDDGSGLHNDSTAGDGIFNNTVALSFDSPGERRFVATVTSGGSVQGQTDPLRIAGVAPLSSDALQVVLDAESAVRQQALAALAAGQDPKTILDAVQAALTAAPFNISLATIVRTDHAIAWENAGGMLSILDLSTLQSSMVPTATSAGAAPPDAASASLAVTTGASCKQAVAISNFAGPTDSFGVDGAEAIAVVLEREAWQVARRASREVPIESFKNLQKYKMIAIAAPGAPLPTFGAYIETGDPATKTARLLNLSDLFNNRLAVVNGAFAILPRFVTRYAGRLPKSIVFVSGLASAVDSSLADAFIGQGAAAFIGFLSAGDFTLDAIVTASSLTTSARKVGEIAEINTGAFKAFGDLEATLPTTCNLLKDNDLLLEYSWPQTQKDLDTQTSFLGAGVGFGCGAGNPYLQWGGDNTSTGGTEFTVVDLFKARQEGRYSTATTVTAHAGWFTPSEGAGPATLTVALRNKQTGLLDAILAKTIEPGTQTSCAPTQVGVIDVTVSTDDDPIITYELR